MKKIILFCLCILLLACGLCVGVAAEEAAVPENYEESDTAYTIYTDEQYKEVLVGVYEGTLPNKTIVLGCDLSVTYDLYMEKPCDITIDLNGKTYTNNYRPVKTGDFDLRHKDAIIRIKNGNMVCNFCVFVFQANRNAEYSSVDNMGQVYLENVNIDSQEEVIYCYGGYGGVLSFKNCNLNVIGNYKTNGGGSCTTSSGMLYQMENCTFDGLNVHCALPGSYLRNCTVYDQELFIDSWHGHGEGGSDVEIELTNVQIDVQLRLNDARIDPVLYDCSYPFVVLGSNQLIVSYTSPTCENAGTKLVYQGSATGVLDGEYYAPALGHALDGAEDVRYINYFEKGFKYGYCERCENNVTETEASVPAAFVSLGFSYSQYDGAANSVAQGFKFNEEVRAYMGDDFEFGVVVAANVSGEATDALSLPKAIKVPLVEQACFEIKINGIISDYCDKHIVFCAYIINNGVTLYLDNGETKSDVKGHSYNEVITYSNSQNS